MKKVTFLALLALVFRLGAGFLQAAEAVSDDEFNNLPGVMNDLERPAADAQASEVPEASAASAAVNDSARTDDSMYTGCAICCSGFHNEPTLSCANGEVAHTFHEACIAQVYARRPGCPVCRSSVPGVPVGRLDPRFLFEAIDRRAGQEDTIDQLLEYFQRAFAATNRVQLFEHNKEVQVPLDGRFYQRDMNAVQYAVWKLPEAEVMRVLDLDIDFAAALNRRMPRWNWTSLDIAWQLKRSVPLLRKLLAKGALANKRARDDEGWLLRDVIAAEQDAPELVARLVRLFLRRNVALDLTGKTLVHLAVEHRRSVQTVRILLDAGATGDFGLASTADSPLHLAAKIGDSMLPVIQLLVERGYATHLRNHAGDTPAAAARRAASSGQEESYVQTIAYFDQLESHDQEIRDEAAWFCTIQ